MYTHTHTYTLTRIHTHTYVVTLSDTQSYSHTLTHRYTCIHRHMLIYSLSPSPSNMHVHTCSKHDLHMSVCVNVYKEIIIKNWLTLLLRRRSPKICSWQAGGLWETMM